jgi:hypothetical protein
MEAANRNWSQKLAPLHWIHAGLKSDGKVKRLQNRKAEVRCSCGSEENGGRTPHDTSNQKEQVLDTNATAEGKDHGRARLQTP